MIKGVKEETVDRYLRDLKGKTVYVGEKLTGIIALFVDNYYSINSNPSYPTSFIALIVF